MLWQPGCSFVMKTDTLVATGGGVVQEEQQVPAQDISNWDGGMRKEWWWEEGPVDT